MANRPDWTIYVAQNRSHGWRDRDPEYHVKLQVTGGAVRIMSDPFGDRDAAEEEMRRLQAEAYKLLCAEHDRRVGR